MSFELAYRPPYDWDSLLGFLRARAVTGVECVDARQYSRTLAIERGNDRCAGFISVSKSTRQNALRLTVSASLARVVPAVLARVRHAFDLGCDPEPIAARLGALATAHPGLRVPARATDSSSPFAPSSASKSALPARGRCSVEWSALSAARSGGRSGGSYARLSFRARLRCERCGAASDRSDDGAHAHADGACERRRRRQDRARRGCRCRRDAPQARSAAGDRTVDVELHRDAGARMARCVPRQRSRREKGNGRNARSQRSCRSEAWRPWRAYAVMHLWRNS